MLYEDKLLPGEAMLCLNLLKRWRPDVKWVRKDDGHGDTYTFRKWWGSRGGRLVYVVTVFSHLETATTYKEHVVDVFDQEADHGNGRQLGKLRYSDCTTVAAAMDRYLKKRATQEKGKK